MIALHRAAHARLRRIRSGEAAEGGFALVFVLVVILIVTSTVAVTLSVTTPNVTRTKDAQNRAGALAAAQAGVDDFLARLAEIQDCRSTSRVCSQALGASSGSAPIALNGDQSYRWTSDSQLTGDYNVRVRSTGTSGNATRTVVADVALSRGILSFGYYTDYESQSPDFLYDYFNDRTIYIGDSSVYSQIDAYNTKNRQLSVTSPTSVRWYGPPRSGTNPLPAAICGDHWYKENGTSGRFSYGSNSVWGETALINSNNVLRNASCDVVFTTGMTLDGPVYTRDAFLISDATAGGAGPVFKQPAYSLWGYSSGAVSYAFPAPTAATPWRADDNVGGNITTPGSYKPATATFDLQLPKNIGTDGLPSNGCTYRGPTRVKLNGNGTATVTSPYTTAPVAGSDPGCYPTGSLAGGVVNYVLNYQTTGSGAIYVKNAMAGNDPVPATWATTGSKSTIAPSSSNSVFYLNSPAGGAATPDQPNTSSALDSSCSSTVLYKNQASYPCAWTNVATAADTGTGTGWSAYSNTAKCNTAIAASNRQLFECEYTKTTGSTVPALTNRYGFVRSQIQSDLASGNCLSGTVAQQTTCLTNLINNRLAPANSGNGTSAGDRRYLVTATSAGAQSQGTPRTVGAAPTPPMQSDPLFDSTSTAAQEVASKTPITFTISRQSATCSLLNAFGICIGTYGWGSTTPQFTTTITQSTWSILNQASAASYFPDNADVTEYNYKTTTASGPSWPGDLYVEGTNSGRLSLLADNDVVVTANIISPESSANAVDLVAGNNVRNYHPVTCADQTGDDIDRTAAGWCPNDITGLYRGAAGMVNNGTLTSVHPAMQYSNMTLPGQSATCTTTVPTNPTRQIDAAVFTLSGSFLTDNYNRGCQLGKLLVNGGIYQSHRGANGVQWEYSSGDTKRATSGYSLQYHYVDLQHAQLPYTPPVTGDGNSKIWSVVSMSDGGSS